jgi:hypothetical protein
MEWPGERFQHASMGSANKEMMSRLSIQDSRLSHSGIFDFVRVCIT